MDHELDIHQAWLRDGQRFERNLRIASSQLQETEQSKQIERTEKKRFREELKKFLLEVLDR